MSRLLPTLNPLDYPPEVRYIVKAVAAERRHVREAEAKRRARLREAP